MTTMQTRAPANGKRGAAAAVRCAIYTRKSSEEGLEQEFNSLDAQRESGELYIASMKHEGWTCNPEKYDDGGYTGGNTDRPALQRLLKDISEGRIDTVLVYKVDRLSRSLMDFARMMELFEKHRISFVSVTQQFNTTHSMGRLTLNILLSFAQFERELVSERTRDKIAGARRRGKWAGGRPILGYDVVASKLIVNEAEAVRVRALFELYIDQESLLKTASEANRRGWRTKAWTTSGNQTMGGVLWDKGNTRNLLCNVAYLGKVRHHENVYEGEQAAIVDEVLFRRVQEVLANNAINGGSEVQNKHGALLKNILRCAACDRAMGHTYTLKKGRLAYRYYKCQAAQKGGRDRCPHGSVPAEQIELFVVEQLRGVMRDPELLARTLDQARQGHQERLAALAADEAALAREARGLTEQARVTRETIVEGGGAHAAARAGGHAARLAELTDELGDVERQLAAVRSESEELRAELPTKSEVDSALTDFDGAWGTLTPRERANAVRLLVKTVAYDGAASKVRIEFHPSGLRSLPKAAEATGRSDGLPAKKGMR